jgi:hypothetical protein
MMETSELHITNIPRADKGRWVAASRAADSDLATWAIAHLNNAAKTALDDFTTPAWAKSLSTRTARCLVNEGYCGKREVRAAFESPDFNWQKIPNFGRKCNDEVLAWLSK